MSYLGQLCEGLLGFLPLIGGELIGMHQQRELSVPSAQQRTVYGAVKTRYGAFSLFLSPSLP